MIKGQEEQIVPYRSNPIKYLIKECDKNAREMRKNAHRKEQSKLNGMEKIGKGQT